LGQKKEVNMTQISLLDHSDYLDHLSKHKDPLEKLEQSINWNAFRPILDRFLKKVRKSNAGQPAFDVIFMQKSSFYMYLSL
jgi:transposase, IS5 family